MGQIPAEYLPPKELWPQRIYTLLEFANLPQRFNSTEELLDKTVAARHRPEACGGGVVVCGGV